MKRFSERRLKRYNTGTQWSRVRYDRLSALLTDFILVFKFSNFRIFIFFLLFSRLDLLVNTKTQYSTPLIFSPLFSRLELMGKKKLNTFYTGKSSFCVIFFRHVGNFDFF